MKEVPHLRRPDHPSRRNAGRDHHQPATTRFRDRFHQARHGAHDNPEPRDPSRWARRSIRPSSSSKSTRSRSSWSSTTTSNSGASSPSKTYEDDRVPQRLQGRVGPPARGAAVGVPGTPKTGCRPSWRHRPTSSASIRPWSFPRRAGRHREDPRGLSRHPADGGERGHGRGHQSHDRAWRGLGESRHRPGLHLHHPGGHGLWRAADHGRFRRVRPRPTSTVSRSSPTGVSATRVTWSRPWRRVPTAS